MPDVQHKRGTRAALDALQAASNLKVGQIYLITDEDRLAVATAANAYQAFSKQAEIAAMTVTTTTSQATYDAATPGANELVVLTT